MPDVEGFGFGSEPVPSAILDSAACYKTIAMKTVDEWKALLRSELKKALMARQTHASAMLRETLAAIDNAEAPPVAVAPTGQGSAAFAGSVAGLGAGEVPRIHLDPTEVTAIIGREIQERRKAAWEYVNLGRREEAEVLELQLELLASLIER